MKKILFLLVLVLSFVFTSCNNMISGADFLARLKDEISYTNQEPFNIRFSAKGGKISPSGDYSCRITDKVSLVFTEDRDMCFLNWQVLLNGEVLETEESSNYIYFEDPESAETKIEIKARVENLTVQANVVERPKVVTTTPVLEQNGVYRDRTVVVMFNQNIDENSIYFTADELKELGVSTSNAIPLETGSKYYYAYWDGKDENSYVFKNIKISNYQYTNINYLKCFGVPKLDATNKKVLRIPTKVEGEGQNIKILAPPSSTEILVTISKNIFTKVGGKPVSLSDDYGWTYYTNSEVDSTPPEFVEYDPSKTDNEQGFVVSAAENNQTTFNPDRVLDTDYTFLKNPLTDLSKLVKMNAKYKKLWVRGTIKDEDSGPAVLKWELHRISTDLYPATDYETAPHGQVDAMTLAGQKAYFNQNLNTSGNDIGGVFLELEDLKDEGVYRIDFKAYDKNDRDSVTKSYYFLYDTVCSCDIDLINITCPRPEYKNITHGDLINSTEYNQNNEHWSYKKTEVNTQQLEVGDAAVNFNFTINQTDNSPYVKLKVYDIFGNYKEKDLRINLKPAAGTIYYSDGFWSVNYDSNRDVVGVICDASDMTKVRIWDLTETSGYIWGLCKDSWGSPPYAHESSHFFVDDGLATLNLYIKNGWSNSVIDYTSYKDGSHTCFWWILNEKRPGTNIDWYIPGNKELDNYIAGNYTVLQQTYEMLNNNGINCIFVSDKFLMTCIPIYHEGYQEKGFLAEKIKGQDSVDTKSCWRDYPNSCAMHCMAQVNLTN